MFRGLGLRGFGFVGTSGGPKDPTIGYLGLGK